MLNFILGAVLIAALGTVIVGLIMAAYYLWNLEGPW